MKEYQDKKQNKTCNQSYNQTKNNIKPEEDDEDCHCGKDGGHC